MKIEKICCQYIWFTKKKKKLKEVIYREEKRIQVSKIDLHKEKMNIEEGKSEGNIKVFLFLILNWQITVYLK
jgi:hypothetical protein